VNQDAQDKSNNETTSQSSGRRGAAKSVSGSRRSYRDVLTSGTSKRRKSADSTPSMSAQTRSEKDIIELDEDEDVEMNPQPPQRSQGRGRKRRTATSAVAVQPKPRARKRQRGRGSSRGKVTATSAMTVQPKPRARKRKRADMTAAEEDMAPPTKRPRHDTPKKKSRPSKGRKNRDQEDYDPREDPSADWHEESP